MRLFRRYCVRRSQREVFRPGGACLFQLERKVEEREIDAERSGSFHVIRLQESKSHTEEIINRFSTFPLFHRKTSKPGGVKTDIGIRSTSNVDTFGGSRLLVKSMFRRTPRQGKCTSTPASVHSSNTTAKRKGIARSLLGEVREVAELR